MTAPWVLDEDDALELLAYLVTAARTQVDEAAEYGPMRLLTAAHRLAEAMGPRASAATAAALAGPLADMPLLAVPRGSAPSTSSSSTTSAGRWPRTCSARYGAETDP